MIQLLERNQNLQEVIKRARIAQSVLETFTQDKVDEAVMAIAWAGYSNAEKLATLAYEQSLLGNIEDKITKVKRKTLGTMQDIKDAKTVGVINEDKEKGITVLAKPMGVIACVLPATNPAGTVVNNILITLKSGNSVVLAPHPRGEDVCFEMIRLAQEALVKVGAPKDLVQAYCVKGGSKAESKARPRLAELMQEADYILATTGPGNVAMGYRSGTPTHGVGVGNAAVIIDKSADLEEAILKIFKSKIFDNATSCSSENSLIIEDSRYDETVAKLTKLGACLLTSSEKVDLQNAMWFEGHLNREIVAQPVTKIAKLAGLDRFEALNAKLLMVEEEGIGEEYPFSGEKLSLVLTLYRYKDFTEAVDKVTHLLNYMGLGHSCGIHSTNDKHIEQLAIAAKVATVLVNQPHSYNNGGAFNNGLDFTLSMGAGTWGKNSNCDNFTYKHFLNYTYLVKPIPECIPTEDELWGAYWEKYGK